jgi:hypothetical protein
VKAKMLQLADKPTAQNGHGAAKAHCAYLAASNDSHKLLRYAQAAAVNAVL